MLRCTLLLLALLNTQLWLNAAEKPRIHVPAVDHPPVLSDFLQERGRRFLLISDFRQREPHDGKPASRATSAYLSHDDRNLYAAFVCTEEPGKVRAHISRRESVTGDDLVGVSLDTFHDGRHAYVFYSNARGIQADGLATEGQQDDYSFDAVWQTEARITQNGYAVLFTIPFRSLRFPGGKHRVWGIALTRFIPGTSEAATWPHLTSKIESYIPQFAEMDGLDTVSPGHNSQIVPYAFAERSTALNPIEPPLYRRQSEIRGGADGRFTFSNGLTLDTTINPDFSQVESDDPQVTINQRYEVAFPEHRPFFQDNASFFDTPETLFFSRRVVDPQYGARLTGKLGSWSLGILAMDDRVPSLQRNTAAVRDPVRAAIAVVRLQRDLGSESTIGMILTNRQVGSDFNRVASLDTRWKLTPNWIFTGQLMASQDKHQLLARTGAASFAELRHAGRHLNYYTNYRWRSPDFHTELGYIPRVDLRQWKTTAGYKWWPETGALLAFGPAVFTLINHDHTGRLTDWSVDSPFYFDFKKQISIATDLSSGYEFYLGQRLRKHSSGIYGSVDHWKRFTFGGSQTTGTAINYYPGVGSLAFSGASRDTQVYFTYRPNLRLRIDGTYFYTGLQKSGKQVYANHLVRAKVSYQFTPNFSLRLITDFNGVASDRDRIDVSSARQFRTDVLATYRLNPWTALYAGYGDVRDQLTLANLMPGQQPQWLLSGRQAFVKVSYLFRF